MLSELEEVQTLRKTLREKEEKIRQKKLEQLNQQIEKLESQIRQKSSEVSQLQEKIEKLKFSDVHLAVLRHFLEKKLNFDYAEELKLWQGELAELDNTVKNLQTSIAALQNEIKAVYEKRELVEKRVSFYSEGLTGFDGSILHLKCPWCGSESSVDVRGNSILQTILSAQTQQQLTYAYSLGNEIHIQCGQRRSDGSTCGYTFKITVQREI